MPFAETSFPVRKYSLRCIARFLSRQITGVPDFEHEHQEILSREHLSRKLCRAHDLVEFGRMGLYREKLNFIDPTFRQSRLVLPSRVIESLKKKKKKRIAATGGPFICILISCPFSCRGVNRRQVVNRHHHDLK